MSVSSFFRSAVAALFHRSRLEAEMDEELRAHIQDRAKDLERSGVPRAEAERRARLEFGGYQKCTEECGEAMGTYLIETLLQDIRYGLHMLRKSPGFTTIAILTLALGIGATTGIFSVVNAVLVRSLPFRDPAQLVAIFQAPGKMKSVIGWAADGPAIVDWQRDSRSFSEIAASLLDSANITGGAVPQHVNGVKVTANYFHVLGVQAAIGRTFSSEDEQAGRNAVVISYTLWRTTFGGQDILGRSIALDGQPFVVIGVMPAVFHDPRTWANPQSDYWILLPETQLAANRGEHMYACFARLAPNALLAQAQQEMDVIAVREAKAFPNTNEDVGVRLSPLDQVNLQTFEAGHFESVGPAILLLQLSAISLLLIACANVANLMLSQSLRRHREFALRAALGASRVRVIRQLLTESVLLASVAAVAGIFLAFWCAKLLLALAPKGYLPPTTNVRIDVQVLAFTLAVAALTGLFFGLLPALRASRRNLNEDLKTTAASSGTTLSRQRARRALVVLEVSATFLMLVGGGLMVRSLARLMAVNPGFDPRHFFTAGISLPPQQYSKPEQIIAFFSAVEQRVRALPGVQAVAFTSAPEFVVTSESDVVIEGRSTQVTGTHEVWPQICIVTPNFFSAAGIPVLQGRDFSPADLATEGNVVIVSQAFAEHFWPRQNSLGKRIHYGGRKGWQEVIGVVGDVRQEGLAAASLPEVYFPLNRETADGEDAMSIVVRSDIPPAVLGREISQQVSAVDAAIPISDVRTGSQILQEWSGYLRYRTTLLASFAVMALLIAAIGVYGTVSYATAQRTHEIGLRLALGAQHGNVFRLVVIQGAKLASLGLAIGVAGGLVLTRWMASLVYGVKPSDPLTFIAVAALLIVVALIACYVPARYAMRVDPMVALRHE
jgi:putative ABC transport system permease protein